MHTYSLSIYISIYLYNIRIAQIQEEVPFANQPVSQYSINNKEGIHM